MSDRVTSHFQIGWRLFKARAKYTQLGTLFVIAFLLDAAGAAILGLGAGHFFSSVASGNCRILSLSSAG